VDRAGEGENGAVIVVIGHNPAYVRLADTRGHVWFEVDTDVWESWDDARRWAVNQAFLDNAIASDAIFLLATPPNEAREGSCYARELDYLKLRGYKARLTGSDWELFR
jgi:hypothetical protein